MKWVGLDWDWVTGDCALLLDHTVACARMCRFCAGKFEFGRGIRDPQDESWKPKLEAIRAKLHELRIIPPIIMRDSHAQILSHVERGDVVYHIDEHDDWPWHKFMYDLDSEDGTDDGMKRAIMEHSRLGSRRPWSYPTCANWRSIALHKGVDTFQSEPCEIRDGLTCRLFVCRSAPYTSADLDGKLLELVTGLGLPIDLYFGPDGRRS